MSNELHANTSFDNFSNGLDPEIFNALSDDEKRVTLQILNDLATEGRSSLYNDLWSEDYDEIPVDIDTFLTDDKFLGKVTENGKIIYPFWRDIYRKLFDPTANFNECITGDTLIPLLNGTTDRLDSIISRVNDNHETIYVYSYDNIHNEYTIGKVTKGVYKGKREVYRVTLDNGKSFKATGDHKVLLRNKHWRRVDELVVNESLMPYQAENPNHSGSTENYSLEYSSRDVFSIEKLPDEEDVYDIEIDNEFHNFVIDSDVVMHNCILSGAIGE